MKYVTTLGALADDTVIILPISVRAIAASRHPVSVCAQAELTPSFAVRHQQRHDISIEEVEYALDPSVAGEIEYCEKVTHEIGVGRLVGTVGKLMRGLEMMFTLVGNGGGG